MMAPACCLNLIVKSKNINSFPELSKSQLYRKLKIAYRIMPNQLIKELRLRTL